MDFEKATQTFLRLFHFTGLSTFDPNPIKTKLNFLKFIYKFGFSVGYSTLMIFIGATQYYNLFHDEIFVYQKITADTRKPGFIYITIDCILYLAIAFQSMCSGDEIKKIYQQIIELNAYIAKKLNSKINFYELKVKLLRMFFIIYTPIVLSTVTMKMIPSMVFPLYYENCQIILLMMSGMILMQAIFFVEIIKYLISHLIEWMQDKPNISNSVTTIEYLPKHFCYKFQHPIADYHHIKLIYYKLWEISKMTSKFFGWNYLLIIFRNWLQAAHQTYGIFILIANFGAERTLARKYLKLFVRCLFYFNKH